MPDLLSHVLLGFALFQLLSIAVPVRRHEVSAGLLGAILPDASKIGLFFNDDPLEAIVGPIDFLGWHTISGIGLSVILVGLVVDSTCRRRSILFVALGAISHVGSDLLLRTASGATPYALFWPISGFRLPTGNLYVSGDPTVLFLSTSIALLSWAIATYLGGRSNSPAKF